MSFEFIVNLRLNAIAAQAKTRPGTALYKVTVNPRDICDYQLGVAGFCTASFSKFQLGNNKKYKIVFTTYHTAKVDDNRIDTL